MEFILELFLGQFIIHFLGVNTRYYFLKMTDDSIKKADIAGDGTDFGNNFLNGLVGFSVFFILFYLTAKIFY
jgi:hypothetical protein